MLSGDMWDDSWFGDDGDDSAEWDAAEEARFGSIAEMFKAEALASYFIEHPELLLPSHRALAEARLLLKDERTTPSFLMAYVAAEAAIKGGMLRPIVAGLVHDAALKDAVVDVVLRAPWTKRMTRLLFCILRECASIDMSSFRRAGETKTLWRELEALRHLRNGSVHEGKPATKEEAERAVAVAAAVLEDLVPKTLGALGFTVSADHRVQEQASPGAVARWGGGGGSRLKETAGSPLSAGTCAADEPRIAYSRRDRLCGAVCEVASAGDGGTGRDRANASA